MPGTDVDRSPAHARVGPQRGRLHDALAAFQELSGATDATGRGWSLAVGAALTELERAWREHVAFTEAPDGLFDELLVDAVEIAAPEIDHLKRDHVVVLGAMTRARELLAAPSAGPDDAGLRDSLAGIAKQVDAHRRRGAELLYNVYSVDPTGGG